MRVKSNLVFQITAKYFEILLMLQINVHIQTFTEFTECDAAITPLIFVFVVMENTSQNEK